MPEIIPNEPVPVKMAVGLDKTQVGTPQESILHVPGLAEVEARSRPQTPRLDPRVVALWDFLCRGAFLEQRAIPPNWMKTRIQQYFDLLDYNGRKF